MTIISRTTRKPPEETFYSFDNAWMCPSMLYTFVSHVEHFDSFENLLGVRAIINVDLYSKLLNQCSLI